MSAQDLLAWAIQRFGERFGIVTSFQAEGMVVLDMAVRLSPGVRVITLDTGRLPGETYDMLERVRERYGVRVETVQPDAKEVTAMVTRFGPDLFYNEQAQRNLCCEVRKVRPLEKKLQEFEAYAVGLRRGQSESRADVSKAAETGGRWKLSPLADWSKEAVWRYLQENGVPVHPLYANGYQSIGCAPCTRAVESGGDERSGRWWWETDAMKECGLHFSPAGKAQRRVDVLLAEVTGI